METTRRRGRSLDEVRAKARIDTAKVDAMTEEDTRRFLIEDGFDPDNPLAGFRPVLSVGTVRRKAGLSRV